MSAKLIGGKELNKRLEAIKRSQGLLRDIQLNAVREAKALVPVKTGLLRRSIRPGGIGPTFAIVSAGTNYAAYVELGTRPHVIKPKSKGVLAWPASSGDRRLSGRTRTGTTNFVYAKRVNHPGTKPHPYLLPGAKAALERGGFRNIIVKQWNEAA